MAAADALLLDAGFAAVPILQAALDAGAEVTVCSGKPGDPGHRLAHRSVVMDYSDVDAVLALTRERAPAALLPGVTDVSYLTGAEVAARRGLPGFDPPETAEIVFRKDRFRAYAEHHGLPVPRAVTAPERIGELRFPVLVKPADAYSGRGIVRVDQPAALEPAYREALAASASGQAVIEEFRPGQLHSHSAFVRQGRIVCEFYVDEYCTVYPYQVNSSCLDTGLSQALKDRVSACIQHIVADLRLCDGLVHTQFIASGEDFWLIELTRRCPGDLYSHLIEYATGVPYAALFAAPFLGHELPLPARRPALRRAIARHTVSVAQDTVYLSLQCRHDACRVVALTPLKACGAPLLAAPFDRAAIVFAEFASADAMQRHTPTLKHHFTLATGPADLQP